jgi:hypothetical protein
MRGFFYSISIFICSSILAQSNSISKHHLGVKTSINISSMIGSALKNPTPKYGYTAGSFCVFHSEKKITAYTEIVGNFKGSNFNNGDLGYSKIALFYVDASVLPMVKLKNKNAIAVGPSLSYLGLSSIYVGAKKKSEIDKLNLKPWDLNLTVFYHIKKDIVTFQFGTKIGLIDIYNNLNLTTISPSIDQGNIMNISFEIGMLF